VKALTEELRQSISGLDMKVGGLRVSTVAIEFDLFTDNEISERIEAFGDVTDGLVFGMVAGMMIGVVIGTNLDARAKKKGRII